MFDIEELVNHLENSNGEHRWRGGNQGSLAVLYGFKRPSDDDDAGIWVHASAGAYSDDRIPAVVDLLVLHDLANLADRDLHCGLSRLGRFLDLIQSRLEIAYELDRDAPKALFGLTQAISDHLADARRLIRHACFEDC